MTINNLNVRIVGNCHAQLSIEYQLKLLKKVILSNNPYCTHISCIRKYDLTLFPIFILQRMTSTGTDATKTTKQQSVLAMPADWRRTRFPSERHSWNGRMPPFAWRLPIWEKSWAAVATSSANTRAATETYEKEKGRTEGRERHNYWFWNSDLRTFQLILE